MPEQREYVRDAQNRICEVRERTDTAQGPKVWLRAVGSSYEHDVDAHTVTPCDADGHPLAGGPGA